MIEEGQPAVVICRWPKAATTTWSSCPKAASASWRNPGGSVVHNGVEVQDPVLLVKHSQQATGTQRKKLAESELLPR